MAKAAKKTKSSKRERRERRFLPQATTSPPIVYGIGGAGALAMGMGVWAQWGRVLVLGQTESLPFAPWLLAGAAVALAVAIWFGTSGEPVLRVGDGGVAVEKNGVQRMAWHQVESVAFDSAAQAVVAKGHGDAGDAIEARARLASQAQAAAWIVREARARVPEVVSIGDEVSLPEAREDGGAEVVKLEAVQVVGKRGAEGGGIIAFEGDARVCPRCERVYHRASVPETCACGGSLASLQDKSEKAESASSGSDADAASPA